MKYDCFYEDESEARQTVQINAIRRMLKLAIVGHVHAGDCYWANDLRSAILLFMKYDIWVDF